MLKTQQWGGPQGSITEVERQEPRVHRIRSRLGRHRGGSEGGRSEKDVERYEGIEKKEDSIGRFFFSGRGCKDSERIMEIQKRGETCR